MATLILGQTLVFWSGILAGVSFALLMATCSVNLDCMKGICSNKKRKGLFRLHRYFVWLAIVSMAVHLILALHSSLFGVYF